MPSTGLSHISLLWLAWFEHFRDIYSCGIQLNPLFFREEMNSSFVQERITKTNFPIPFECHQLMEYQEMLPKQHFQTSKNYSNLHLHLWRFIFSLRLILFYTKNNAVLCDSNPVSTTSIQGMFCLLFMYLRHKFAALNQGMPQMVRCLDYFCQLKKESACSPLP